MVLKVYILMEIPFLITRVIAKISITRIFLMRFYSGYLIGGPFVDQVENQIQNLTGINNCVCVGNATDALEIIFDYIKLPFNSNVLVPSHTMLATASAAKVNG